VSSIGLGCATFLNYTDRDTSRRTVIRALDLGITLFDAAESYGNHGGSEMLLGEILGPRRKDVVVAFLIPFETHCLEGAP